MESTLTESEKQQSNCRSCLTGTIKSFLNLGDMHLTGYFPEINIDIPKQPLDLGKCDSCGLVQLVDRLSITELYGKEYGYESNLNESMKTHLQSTARYLEDRFNLNENDHILDIASNDGTLLSGYKNSSKLFGVDPIIVYLNDHYPESAVKVSSFFSKEAIEEYNKNKFKLITSFSVYYDLDDPVKFALDIENVLTDDGVWVLEQSYLPSMFNTLGFDTICHEHLLYLTLTDLDNIFQKSGLKIFDVKINEVNGGSFQVYVCKIKNTSLIINPYVNWLINWEKNSKITSYENCLVFALNIKKFASELRGLLRGYKDKNYFIFGLGASTKGNVLLQYCNLEDFIVEIGEINPKKFGKYTPGTKIPIIDESKLLNSVDFKASHSLGIILPWHFKNSIKKSATQYLNKGGSLLVPLPFPSVI
jgi:hypothetical protein